MRKSSATRRLLFALSGGLFLALTLPGLQWWPLALLFPAGMLEALGRKSGWKVGILLGWATGALHWMISAYWVLPLLSGYGTMSGVAASACLLGTGLFLGSTWALFLGLLAVFPWRLRPVAFPALWILVEGIRSFPPYDFPWNSTAACLSGTPALLPSLSIWGASGLGWTLIALGSGFWALRHGETRKSGILLVSCALGFFLLLTTLAPAPKASGDKVVVAALQPGTLLEERWDPANWRRLSENVREMTFQAGASNPKLILWPESAMPFRFDSAENYREEVFSMSRELGATILLNSVASGKRGGLSNSVFAVSPSGTFTRYDKIHLVPFGEYIPTWGRFFFPGSLVHEVGHFRPGREVSLLDAGFPVGISVCFEIVFPRLAAAETRKGAAALVTLTNDGWYGRSWASDQHFAQAVLRAVETRRWVLRAALTGISGLISPEGRVCGQLEAGETGILEGEFQPMQGLTPAARFPDLWNICCLLFLLAIFVFRKPPG